MASSGKSPINIFPVRRSDYPERNRREMINLLKIKHLFKNGGGSTGPYTKKAKNSVILGLFSLLNVSYGNFWAGTWDGSLCL
jgi:hypothetical protein